MRMGLCLALLVCTVLVIESDAWPGWGPCTRMRYRRDLNEDSLADRQSAQDDVRCSHMVDLNDVTNVSVPFDLVVFKMVDGDDGDDVLNEREYLLFMEAMGDFKHCFRNETSSA